MADYDFITCCNWTATGTYTLRAFRGSLTNVVTSFSLFYRKKGDPSWIETTDGTINIASTGEWEVGNDWNKTGNNVLTHSYFEITAINSCTEISIEASTLGATVGDSFMREVWRGCSNLASMPVGFNLPTGITSVGDSFLTHCWRDCTSLTSMPAGFNLPTGITSVGDYFLYSCWYGCSNLASMPSGFNLPTGITSIGDYFMREVWRGCSNLASMPVGFNLPTGITSVGTQFLRACWYDCSNLASMPSGFNLPTGITSVGDYFLYYCWYNCTLLNNDASTEDIIFDYDSTNTFGGTCPIEPDSISGATPESPISVAVNRSTYKVPIIMQNMNQFNGGME